MSGDVFAALQHCSQTHNVLVRFLVHTPSLCPLFFPLFYVSSFDNNHCAIVAVLSVNCEHILMSPHFHSALAAFACHLPLAWKGYSAHCYYPLTSHGRLVLLAPYFIPVMFSSLLILLWKKSKALSLFGILTAICSVHSN